ncbi:MAG: hypothetical protein IKD22_06785, partial [Lentisphaeria bacterium]|nr:hypothetical protein [Lentisphaeria bacterium]
AAALLSSVTAFAGEAAAPYANSRIDARLNVTVKEDTQVVHFVRDNADPNVITKAYEIKYTDPYELRSYIRAIVQTRKVDESNTNVEAVKFADGTALLLISAEDYRFEDTPGAQGFDSIVRELDKPQLISSSGRLTYVYAPRFRSSQDLLEMVKNVGAYSRSEAMNNVGGNDILLEDPELNLLFFNTAPFSKRNIMELLSKYDQIEPSVRVRVKVYELYAENDTKLGLDFQAWKNNEGIDLLSTGGRFSRNYNGLELFNAADWNKTTYFQFNPKWNTKYIDFLTSKGKAKILHTSEITIGNNAEGKVEKFIQCFVAKTTPAAEKEYNVSGNRFSVNPGDVIGVTHNNREISVSAAAMVTVSTIGSADTGKYILKIASGSAAHFTIDGADSGKRVNAAKLADDYSELIAKNAAAKRGNIIDLEATDKFGFSIKMTPAINNKASKLKVRISNSSLIGYTSDGAPRIQQGAEINTEFMIANTGNKLVIGGIEKRSVMRVSGGVPLLKDLPLLGWIFSTETEATKRSQLLVVAEVIPAGRAGTPKGVIKDIEADLSKAGKANTFGYRQFLLDGKRN